LIAPDVAYNERFNLEYEVGDVWEIEVDLPAEILPPHTENVVVRRKRRVGRADDLPDLIERCMPPRFGGREVLHDGLAKTRPGGPLYVTQRTGVPAYSTMFWRPDRPLVRDTGRKRIRYRYPTDDGGRTLTFTGFQEPPEVLPAGTLLRVSLAHWWRPEEAPEEELRCYVQLSGWFGLPAGIESPDAVRFPADEHYPDDEEPVVPLDEARRLLRQVFGYDDFRPLQADVIANLLARRDSLAVMPTGSGKSMCFQLPALLFPGLTVVVSPLISLMEDQVRQLRQSGVPAACLNSTLPHDGYVAIMRQIRAGQIKLLYTSPETLLRPETLVMLDDCRVDCLTIDEAHCISEWGHDFRPEYRQLVQVRRRLPDAVCLAVTATATERVRQDIKRTLAVGDADEFVSSFDRENLFLAVTPRESGPAQIEAFLEGRRGESGLIYCATRERTEVLAEWLAARGWSALPYHAGLDYAIRRENQRRFAHEEGVIIVATIAFGMGINKSNVRFVIHHDLPKDLENYYQQIGRAGRDGLPADCLLLFSRADVVTINFLADKGEPTQRAAAAARLQAMVAFAETGACRRRPLLTYFGESDIPETCGRCDNCLAGERERVDL
ncbi:MAG TPA: ATP-dependent DNA helicase RecQ, partial [Promineifilum sp.]|nr:ATP-dependent DNA helicase RecQ [Promineifilum sp.]